MKILIEIGNKTFSIGIGWINLAKSHLGIADNDTENLAVRRLALCLACEHNIKNKCTRCGCPIFAKVRSSNEKCPQNKW